LNAEERALFIWLPLSSRTGSGGCEEAFACLASHADATETTRSREVQA
jgi:hypothetical protein